MSNRRWCTKEDVLQDLAKATGKKVKNIHKNYFVIGEDPPPRLVLNNEDCEMVHYSSDRRRNNDDVIKPDLQGITEMLQIVKEHNGYAEDVAKVRKFASSPKPLTNTISISKLDPNVKEFVPKSAKMPSIEPNKDKVHNDSLMGSNCLSTDQVKANDCITNKSTLKETLMKNKICSKENIINGIVMNESLVEAKVSTKSELESKNNTQDIATVLKNKITLINASEKCSFQAKKERNVALANLQKLYSIQPEPMVSIGTQQTVKKAIKLITPDFFENFVTGTLDNKDKETARSQNIIYITEEPRVERSHDILEKEFCSMKSLKTMDQDKIIKDYTPIKSNLSDPEMQHSIKKVKNWLNITTERQKTPVPYLGAVSFKRKDGANRSSPNVIDKKISKTNMSNNQQYIPTKYASDLTKMYMERVKNKEKERKPNSLDSLYEKLKEQDNVILQNQSKSSSSASNVCELSD